MNSEEESSADSALYEQLAAMVRTEVDGTVDLARNVLVAEAF